MLEFLPHVYGQEKAKAALSRLLSDGRLPHTMIFYGDEGLGKTTAALDLAGAVTGGRVYEEITAILEGSGNEKLPALTAAGDAVWYLTPSGMELKVEQFRLFLEAMPTFDERPHVCVIDEAQTMLPPIANAMLKTLEEPGKNIYFILITHDLDALLPTIISRAERFAFFPLSRVDYEALLKVKPEEFHFSSAEELRDAFLLSEGNPGLTKEMFSAEGAAQPETAMKFWETVTESTIPFTEGMASLGEDRKELRRMLRWLMLTGRDLLVAAAAPEADLLRCRQVAERVRRLAPLWGEERLTAALETLKTADAAARRYISVKNIWDMVLISLDRIREGQ